jgi:hypothetical protein
MTGRTALPISLAAALLAAPAMMPQAAAQAVGADEAHVAGARLGPISHLDSVKSPVAVSPAQRRAIYAAVSRQRLRTPAADIPLTVGATVPRSAPLLTLPEEARGDLSVQDLKYATVDDNVVLVDPASMRVIDVIRSGP